MFKKLRNKFILTNMIITTAILVVAFGSIYAASAATIARPPEMMPQNMAAPDEVVEMVRSEVEHDRNKRLNKLAITLLAVGLMTELLVFLASYYYAEKSIRPVKDAYERQREFIANASHELKTPIAAIRANFEALDAKEEPWTSNIDAELTHANQLVLDLLTLARTNNTEGEKKKKTDLAALTRKKVEIIKPRLDGKKLTVGVPEKLEVETYGSDFGQILDILLDNAAKYSKSKVWVELSGTTLSVRNDGKTIPREKLEKVFERFYQVDKTANGTGLGLAIAKSVADKHKWQLGATSEKGVTEFKLRV